MLVLKDKMSIGNGLPIGGLFLFCSVLSLFFCFDGFFFLSLLSNLLCFI